MKFNPFKSLAPAPDDAQQGVTNFDESVLQQGRFWMRTVTWTLIGTTVFGVGWLALARTEEIPFKLFRCPWEGLLRRFW